MRRDYKTASGIWVSLVSVEIKSPYFGAIEITNVRSANEWFFENETKRGVKILGYALAAPPRDPLPGEMIRAEFHSDWLPEDRASEAMSTRSELVILCFQKDGADPFQRIAAEAAKLDWPSLATIHCWD